MLSWLRAQTMESRQENLGSIPYSDTHLCSESYFLNRKMVMILTIYLKALL